MKHTVFTLMLLITSLATHAQRLYTSTLPVIELGAEEIEPIENDARIIEKGVTDILFREKDEAISSINYVLYSDKVYRLTAFINDPENSISRLYIKLYKKGSTDGTWDYVQQVLTSSEKKVVLRYEPSEGSEYKVELYSVFRSDKSPTYIRYNLLIDREL